MGKDARKSNQFPVRSGLLFLIWSVGLDLRKGPSQPVCFAGVESCGGHFHLYRNCSSQSPGFF